MRLFLIFNWENLFRYSGAGVAASTSAGSARAWWRPRCTCAPAAPRARTSTSACPTPRDLPSPDGDLHWYDSRHYNTYINIRVTLVVTPHCISVSIDQQCHDMERGVVIYRICSGRIPTITTLRSDRAIVSDWNAIELRTLRNFLKVSYFCGGEKECRCLYAIPWVESEAEPAGSVLLLS